MVDVAVGQFYVIHSRFLVIDYTISFGEESESILTPAPSQNIKLFACFKPFQAQVIIWIIHLILFVSVVVAPI